MKGKDAMTLFKLATRLLACVLIAPIAAFASVAVEHVETNDIREIWKYVSVNTLVIVEIENVCVTCTHQLGTEEWADMYARGTAVPGQSFVEARAAILPLWNRILEQADVCCIDHSVQDVIRSLQMKNIPTMGLCCKDPDIAYTMLRHLRSVDVDFLKRPPLPYHLAVRADSPAKFVDGVLFTGVYNHPGHVVANFLESVRDCFRIVVVSNNYSKLQQIYEGINRGGDASGLSYIGIRLGLADKRVRALNPQICQIQHNCFDRVLSNEAAEVLQPQRTSWFW